MHRTGKELGRKQLGEGGVSKILFENFKVDESKAKEFLEEFFDEPIELIHTNILKSLGKAFSISAGIPFPRNYKRNKSLIIKWFEENIDEINKQKGKVILVFADDENEPNKENEDIYTK